MQYTTHILFSIMTTAALVLNTPAAAQTQKAEALSLGTDFTYQGELDKDGVAADGIFDFLFQLYDSDQDGEFLGQIASYDHTVANGLFRAELDFGQSITGESRWLEIHVRNAGDGGPFTALSPRQKLAGADVSPCEINEDLIVEGQIGVKGYGIRRETNTGGMFGFAAFGQGLSLGSTGFDSIFLDGEGFLGIHAIPTLPLMVSGGTDVTLTDGTGQMEIGHYTGANIVFDSNEIQARNNGAASSLYLNHDGGLIRIGGSTPSSLDVEGGLNLSAAPTVGGHMDPRWERVEVTCNGTNTCNATCPAGKVVLMGGCRSSCNCRLINSTVISDTEWHCDIHMASPVGQWVTTSLICADIS